MSGAPDRVIVEADGGSRGNPGPAGYGAVVRDAATGELLAERQDGLGVVTNNVAEYQGLIAGLRAAAELGASTVDVRMDSKLVVEQLSGRWKIKNAALKPLAEEAKELAAGFRRVGYEWIPRARNAHADRLANAAMDAQAAKTRGEIPGDPPAETAPRPAKPTVWTGFTGTPTRMLMLRHGQTALSIERRYSGRGDIPLNETGLRQAEAAAKRLAEMDGVLTGGEPAPVISSPLGRATRTAQAVASAIGGQVRPLHGLVETDFGEWEGLTFAEAAERDPDLHQQWLGDASIAAPGGESFEATHRRVRKARDELIAGYGGRTIVVVSHVTPSKALLRMGLDAGPSLLFRLHLDLASLSIVDFYPDGNASVRLVNDISHLT